MFDARTPNPNANPGPPKSPALKATLGPKSTQVGSKIDPEVFQKSINFVRWLGGRVLVPSGANLDPTWRPKPFQNRAKLVQKTIRNWINMVIIFLLDFCLVWGRFFANFASKLEGRDT